jgi:hypothetical protein
MLIKQQTITLMLAFLHVPYFDYSLSLRKEAVLFTESSVNFYYTTQRYVPTGSEPYCHH